MRIVLIAYCALIVGCAHGSDPGQDPWATFLSAPTPENENHLMSSIRDDLDQCDWGNEKNRSAVPDKVRQGLFASIAGGDTSSLRVGVSIERCLDGGDLGDFRRSAGQFFDRRPNVFIDEVLKLGISPERFSALIARLPLELADNRSGQAELVKSRRNKLKESLSSANAVFYEHGANTLDEIQESLSNIEERD